MVDEAGSRGRAGARRRRDAAAVPTPVTLAEVAERAGVSLATASRALNGSARTVGAGLRDRVLAAAADLGYTPNTLAQAVARGSSNVLGLVVHDIADPYFAAIAAGVMPVAAEQGLLVTLGSTQRDFDRERAYLTTLAAQRARAVVLAGSRSSSRQLTERLAADIRGFVAAGGRVAAIGQSQLGADTVLPENRAGARSLAQALVRLGHRRFAVLAGPPDLLTARDRLAGFRAGLAEAGVLDRGGRRPGAREPSLQVVPGAFTRDGGHRSATELIAAGLTATCVFAVNDVMAVGALAAFREHGVRVPADVSVAGFDDIETLRDVVPGLTTVRLPLGEMGRRAAELALHPDAGPPRVVRIRGQVVLRESTAPVPAR